MQSTHTVTANTTSPFFRYNLLGRMPPFTNHQPIFFSSAHKSQLTETCRNSQTRSLHSFTSSFSFRSFLCHSLPPLPPSLLSFDLIFHDILLLLLPLNVVLVPFFFLLHSQQFSIHFLIIPIHQRHLKEKREREEKKEKKRCLYVKKYVQKVRSKRGDHLDNKYRESLV